MNTVSNCLIFLVSALHIFFFVLERFVWSTPTGQKIFKITAEQAIGSATLAANQGVYNLMLAIGLLWSLFAFKTDATRAVQIFILVFIMFVGTYGALTVSKSIFFLQVIPALFALVALIAVMGVPRMNDVVTNLDQPTEFRSLKGKNYESSFITLQKQYYPEVLPLKSTKTPAQVFEVALRQIAQKTKWEIVTKDPNKGIIEARETTRFFRFTDDIVIQIEPSENLTTINMRSRSQTGKSDFGVNAQRIVEFLRNLKIALAD